MHNRVGYAGYFIEGSLHIIPALGEDHQLIARNAGAGQIVGDDYGRCAILFLNIHNQPADFPACDRIETARGLIVKD